MTIFCYYFNFCQGFHNSFKIDYNKQKGETEVKRVETRPDIQIIFLSRDSRGGGVEGIGLKGEAQSGTVEELHGY